jgi:hypothetical protein
MIPFLKIAEAYPSSESTSSTSTSNTSIFDKPDDGRRFDPTISFEDLRKPNTTWSVPSAEGVSIGASAFHCGNTAVVQGSSSAPTSDSYITRQLPPTFEYNIREAQDFTPPTSPIIDRLHKQCPGQPPMVPCHQTIRTDQPKPSKLQRIAGALNKLKDQIDRKLSPPKVVEFGYQSKTKETEETEECDDGRC